MYDIIILENKLSANRNQVDNSLAKSYTLLFQEKQRIRFCRVDKYINCTIEPSPCANTNPNDAWGTLLGM